MKNEANIQAGLYSVMIQDGGWIPDETFLARIKKTYRLAISKYEQPAGTIWGDIDGRRAAIHRALTSDDDSLLRKALSDPEGNLLYVGIEQIGGDFFNAFRNQPDFSIKSGQSIYAHLLGAAHSLGAVALPYPEDAARIEPTYSTDELLDRIGALVGDAFSYPNNMLGEIGLPSRRGIISWKVPMALYQAYRLADLANLVGGSKVLEIGPGVGRTALHARQLNCFSSYATIDLPLGIVAQACFLEATIGRDAYWMIGDDHAPRPNQIRLLLAGDLNDEKFDIILNVDSLTEMPRDQAKAYFDYALRNAKVFFSINHEINPFRVCDLEEARRCTVMRHVSAIRPGYAEEYFFPLQIPDPTKKILNRWADFARYESRRIFKRLTGS